jgi:Bacterial regulatory helix-turn-helix protein, lysR family
MPERGTPMEIRQIEVFPAVMEHSTVTLAAQKLHLSPGAVSLQLHNLARELHTQLFVRSGKRIVPTREAFRAGGTRKRRRPPPGPAAGPGHAENRVSPVAHFGNCGVSPGLAHIAARRAVERS